MPQQTPDAAAEAKAQSQNPIETLTGQDDGEGNRSNSPDTGRPPVEQGRSFQGPDSDPAEGKR